MTKDLLPDHQTYEEFMAGVKRKQRLPPELQTKGFQGSRDPSLKALIGQGKIKASFTIPYLTIPERVISPPPEIEEVKNFMAFLKLGIEKLYLKRKIERLGWAIESLTDDMEKLKRIDTNFKEEINADFRGATYARAYRKP